MRPGPRRLLLLGLAVSLSSGASGAGAPGRDVLLVPRSPPAEASGVPLPTSGPRARPVDGTRPDRPRPQAPEEPPPGWLLGAELTARLGTGGAARVEVVLELGGVGGHASLPVQALAFGAVPGDVTATVNGGAPVPVDLVETRPGFWEGRVQLASGVGEVVALRLAYGVPEALRAAPGAGDGAGELALPWVLVPWAPEDGAPDRVRVRVGFNGPVRLAAAFPAGLRAEPPGSRADAAEWWGSSLAVLPALVRARVEGLPAPAVGSVLAEDASGPGSGGPPPMPAPGFVFSGLFLAFGLVVAAYLAWMIRHERRA